MPEKTGVASLFSRRPEDHTSSYTARRISVLWLIVCGGLLAYSSARSLFTTPHVSRTARFAHLSSHCAHIKPIVTESFIERQDALANALHKLGAAAYIAEPSANAGYYANISGSHWHISERPLLLIVTPSEESGVIRGRLSILTPAFEATRARLLPIPTDDEIAFPEWPEDANPYEVAISAIPALRKGGGAIYVDGAMRQFIVDGLQQATTGHEVQTAPVEIRRLRERKTAEELEILQCVNEVTLLAIRAVRKDMYIGIRESEARRLMQEALTAAGLRDVYSLTLFGLNAALPHGSGTDRVLGKADFVLIDCGGSLYGYNSDVTRTFALPDSEIPVNHLDIWNLVYKAQSAAIHAARNGTITATVDKAARHVIKEEGYGKYFTHRLGHGIGLEVHEAPYLRGGSEDIILTGHSFSDEPGVYIEDKVGVRLEDCFYIDKEGKAVFLTAGAGGQAGSPWEP